jgi:UDP:flavonoid glycosyltransferase YjiC (YdhE family)
MKIGTQTWGSHGDIRPFLALAEGAAAPCQSPSAEECSFTSDDDILYVATKPHHVIFPHCRAVVHHGGAGATQSVMRAGKPSVVVANISEQEHWGRELRQLGMAGRIRSVLASPGMAVRAREVAGTMANDHGVNAAVERIMRTFAGRNADEVSAASAH